jgi:RNA polymerase sigma-B factor
LSRDAPEVDAVVLPGLRVSSRAAGPVVIDRNQAKALFLKRDINPAAREALIEGFLPFAASLARRFAGRGQPVEDLVQTATIGLIRAVDRYDPARGTEFTAFASSTIVGELKRHLRDVGWSVRVSRRLKEQALLVSRTRDELSARLGRSPTIREIGAAVELSPEAVVEALQAGQAYLSVSLDAPVGDEAGADTLSDRVGVEDEAFAVAERLAVVADAVRALPARQRRILFLRFYRDLTQAEIAIEVGISQMHVSRLLAQALDAIRSAVVPGQAW